MRFFSTWPQPVIVPPVPMPATITSSLPPVSLQISSAVVCTCTAGLAGLVNWPGITAPGVAATISSALAMAPFMPFSAGVNTSSAPRKASSLRRSIDIDSGMVRMSR